MTTPETATSIRYKLAEAEFKRRVLSDQEQQWEAIAKHYMAHANIARVILHMLNLRRGYDFPSPDLDRTIQMHIDTIKANHLRDFGIELEWPFQPEPCGDCDPCLGGRPDQCAMFPTEVK